MNKIKKQNIKPGEKFMIRGDHPHAGEIAEFVEIRHANHVGEGMVFKNEWDAEFFVFDERFLSKSID